MFRFCYVGRIVERQKRVDMLLEFLSSLQGHLIDFHCDIFGTGNDTIINQLHAVPNVTVHGQVKDWIKCVTEEHIFLMFSDYEGCPLSLLEFHKYVGPNFLVRNSQGLKQYVSDNCLFNDVDCAVAKVKAGTILTNTADNNRFFSDFHSRLDLQLFFSKYCY